MLLQCYDWLEGYALPSGIMLLPLCFAGILTPLRQVLDRNRREKAATALAAAEEDDDEIMLTYDDDDDHADDAAMVAEPLVISNPSTKSNGGVAGAEAKAGGGDGKAGGGDDKAGGGDSEAGGGDGASAAEAEADDASKKPRKRPPEPLGEGFGLGAPVFARLSGIKFMHGVIAKLLTSSKWVLITFDNDTEQWVTSREVCLPAHSSRHAQLFPSPPAHLVACAACSSPEPGICPA